MRQSKRRQKEEKKNIQVFRTHSDELFIRRDDRRRSEIFIAITASNHGGKVRVKLVKLVKKQLQIRQTLYHSVPLMFTLYETDIAPQFFFFKCSQ